MDPVIYFATDHAGFELKNILVAFVRDELKFDVVDCGADAYDENDDFTDFIAVASREVSADPKNKKAIILGGSGQGEAMLANRFHDVRAVVYYGGNEEIIRLSRVHNDANILSLGARFINVEDAKKTVKLWLETPHVTVEKYDRRIAETEEFSTQQESQVLRVKDASVARSMVPSVPAESFSEIAALLDTLEGVAKGIQIDIVDGLFIPYNISWPFTDANVELALQRLSSYSDLEIEIDCMCMEPLKYLDLFASIGVKRVVVHAGSTEKYEECITHAKEHNYKMGFAIVDLTPFSFLDPFIERLDFVQVMGIAHIGVQGEPFEESTLETVARLRNMHPTLEIAVDGGVNETTIPKLLEAGANRFAPGSAITKASDPVASYKQLAAMVGL